MIMNLIFAFFCIFCSFIVDAVPKIEEFIDPMRHDIFLVTAKSFDSLITRHRNAYGVAVLLFFNGKDPSVKKYINKEFNEAAKQVKGMIKMGAVDCNEWRVFCKDNLKTEFKSSVVIVYPPNPLPPVVLEKTDVKTITSTALRYIPSAFVELLSSDNIDSFLTSHVAVPKVMLFSSKDTPPVMYKALGIAFKDRISFGMVPPSEKNLIAKYKVKKTPTLMVIKAAVKGLGLGKPEIYTGKMTYEAIHIWLNASAETFVKGGGFSEGKDGDETPRPWLVQKVPEMTGPSHQDICFKGSNLCVVYLTKGSITTEQMSQLEKLSSKYSDGSDREARFRWMWMNLEIETGFQQLFKIDMNSRRFPTVVVINPHKRLRYLSMPEDREASAQNIDSLIEKILSGDGRFTIIKGQKLPPFAPRDEEGKSLLHQKDEL